MPLAPETPKTIKALADAVRPLIAALEEGVEALNARVEALRGPDLDALNGKLAALKAALDGVVPEEPEDDPPVEDDDPPPEDDEEEDDDPPAPAPPTGPPQTGEMPFGTSRLTFSEDFKALDFAKWKPRFDFGNQSNADSLRYAHDNQPWCAVDPRTMPDRNPFEITPDGLKIRLFKNPNPSDPRFLAYGKPATWLCGVLTTSPSFRQRYGYFEAEMTLTSKRGSFPAFWGTEFDTYDEIDVMELVSANPRRLWFHAHKPRSGEGHQAWSDSFDPTQRHAYGVRWTANEVVWYVDRQEVARKRIVLDKPLVWIIDHVCGGWDGNDQGIVPSDITVHSVKAWA